MTTARTRSGSDGLLRLLGLARRAGCVASGVEATRRALRAGEASLVLVAGDASAVQVKKIEGLLGARGVPGAVVADRDRLGRAVGGPPLSAVALTDRRFAERLLRELPGGTSEVGQEA